MAIKVVVVDAAQLPASVEFPPLAAGNYGWEQYLSSDHDDLVERCWKADVLISLATPIKRNVLEKTHRLKLVITAGSACAGLDQAAARERGVEFLAFPDAHFSKVTEARELCARISMAIDHYISNFER